MSPHAAFPMLTVPRPPDTGMPYSGVIRWAKDAVADLIREKQRVSPAFFLIGPEKVIVLQFPSAVWAEKPLRIGAFIALIRKFCPEACMVASACRMVDMPREEREKWIDADGHLKPDVPGKKDGVMIMFEDRLGEFTCQECLEVVCPPDDEERIIEIKGEWVTSPLKGKLEGDMVGLFKKAGL